MAAILNFCQKMEKQKFPSISLTVQDRAISQSTLANFVQVLEQNSCFPLGGHYACQCVLFLVIFCSCSVDHTWLPLLCPLAQSRGLFGQLRLLFSQCYQILSLAVGVLTGSLGGLFHPSQVHRQSHSLHPAVPSHTF